MSQLTIRGSVSRQGGDLRVAGVTVAASIRPDARSDAKGSFEDRAMQIGRAETESDGSFVMHTDAEDPVISRWACVLQNCGEFAFQLACFDRDGTLLHESEPLSYVDERTYEIELPEPALAAGRHEWEELSGAMVHSRLVRLGDVATELTTLAPRGIFRGWSVNRRLGMLGRLEQALLDPSDLFAQAGVRVRFARLSGEPELLRLREEVQRLDRQDLTDAVETVSRRNRDLGGSFADINPFVDTDLIKRGDVVAGVNKFLEPGVEGWLDLFPWMKSPTLGYRDYLRDRWCDHQRIEPQFGGSNIDVATRSTMIDRLNNRFHQDFRTADTTDQPANRVLVPIFFKMLPAPPGTGYGFGLAAPIDPQGDRTDREYLDYLISLTGFGLEELEKRYRLDLRRSDLERSNPVQQNIDTLQRFFTDSYQSIEDPFAITPDRKPGKPELIIVRPYDPDSGTDKPLREGAGPFFLEYEEWLRRDEPFYPENHYDPRRTYSWTFAAGVREAVAAKSIPVAEFLYDKSKPKYLPATANDVAAKWQWVRNHIDLQDLINLAHDDAKSLNYQGAEDKYKTAKQWTKDLRALIGPNWDYVARQYPHWGYSPEAVAKEQKNADVSTMEKLTAYERKYAVTFGGVDLLAASSGISSKWWGDRPDLFPGPGYRGTIAYLLEHLYFRVLPACISEMQLALGKYAEAVRELNGQRHIYRQDYWWFPGPAGFIIFQATQSAGGALRIGARLDHFTEGALAYSSTSDRTTYPRWDDPHMFPELPPTSVPTNRGELGYYRLRLGNAALEWADVLYRSNEPENIMRARELYKAVIFLHGEDPEITPHWARRGDLLPSFPWKKSAGNPAVVSQVTRGRLGFMQINAGLNYYGISPTHVPPLRYRVVKEAADRFAAGAKGAQGDFLNYMQQLDQLTVAEMQARTMVAKGNAAIKIAQEQQKIADFNVGEAQKQVDGINAQIAAKKAEITKKDEFFEQVKDFAGGMKDSVMNLGEMAFKGEGAPAAAGATQLSTGDILSLGFKVGTASNVLGAGTQALGGAAGVAGPFGAFLYAGVSSMSSLADAIAKRAGELAQLENVALPAAKALVELKKRDVTIAQLSQTIAQADAKLGTDLLTYYGQRFLNRQFLVSMAEFSNRLMRRYLDLAGRTAWLAERALAFEQDRDLAVIAFDYFPRNLRGVSGADLLQLHLAELDAARIQGLTQTIPVKQTYSLARDFPVPFGQLKKTGFCRFTTSEAPLPLVHPGVFGYRIRNITIAITYAAAIQPHRGLFSNHGVSRVTRNNGGPGHTLVRYPDALPLSEFRMREDMWVFDLPDETLLPFEGSGLDTAWELMLSKIGNANSFEAMTDVLITMDMRASYSAFLQKQHVAALPASVNRSLLASAKALNPGALATFRQDGGQVTLAFDLAKLARNSNETSRKTLNFVLVAVGVDDTPFDATFSSSNPVKSEAITFKGGVTLSNAGALADGNGGVPLPLNSFVGLDTDQTFKLVIDADANAGTDFTHLNDVLLLAEYKAAL